MDNDKMSDYGSDIKYLKWYKKISPWMRIIRLPLAFLGFIFPLSLVFYRGILFSVEGISIIMIIFFINCSLNVYNEIQDIEDDRKNKPHRPLPSGEISIKNASNFALFLLLISLFWVFTLLITTEYVFEYPLFILIAIVGAIIYNFYNRAFIGNISMGFAYAGAALLSLYPDPEYLVFPIAFGFFVIGFNISVQLHDREFDEKSTISNVLAENYAIIFSSILVLISSIIFYVYSNFWWFLLPNVSVLITNIIYYIKRKKYYFEIGVRGAARILLIISVVGIIIYSIYI